MHEELRCDRCGRTVDGLSRDAVDWESDGDTDEHGFVVAVCPGCDTREEEQSRIEGWIGPDDDAS